MSVELRNFEEVTYPGSKLENGILAIYERHSLEDDYRVVRRVSKVSAGVISFIAKVPYITISMQLGNKLGPFFAAGNVTGFFILEYWAASKTIDSFLGPKTRAEKELEGNESVNKCEVCRKVIILSGASLLAIASQLPSALAGYEYNSEEYKYVGGLIVLIAGSLIPIRSLQLSIEYMRYYFQQSAASEVFKIKGKMINLIRANQQAFVQGSYENKLALIQECNEISNFRSPAEKVKHYTLALLKKPDLQINYTKKIVGSVFNYTGLGIGAALAAIFEYALGEYTFDVTKEELLDNDVMGATFATLAVATTSYLFGKSLIGTTQRIFNVVGNFVVGNEVRNLGWQLRPKLSFALTSIGLLIDIGALGATYIIWGDFYNKNEVMHEVFQKSMCASLFIILFTATLDIIDDIITSSIVRGSDEEREILEINQEFQRLINLIEKSSTQEFIGYLLDNTDISDRDTLLKRLRVTAQQLLKCSRKLNSTQELLA